MAGKIKKRSNLKNNFLGRERFFKFAQILKKSDWRTVVPVRVGDEETAPGQGQPRPREDAPVELALLGAQEDGQMGPVHQVPADRVAPVHGPPVGGNKKIN